MKRRRRIARVSGHEVAFRLREMVRTTNEALVAAVGRAAWRREDLLGRLKNDLPELSDAARALAEHDWDAADLELQAHFRRRPRRFLIDPAAYRHTAASIRQHYPAAPREAARRAEQILHGQFDLLGYHALSFGSAEAPDWHADPVHRRRAPLRFWKRVPYLDPACGDHKIIWELNRQQYFLALGRAAWLTDDERYAEVFVRHIENWMSANPPLVGINWASMLELAFRSISWLWALHFFSADMHRQQRRAPWAIDLLLGLDRQLEHVASHLSLYFSPNTHLLGEALALYVVGTCVPELRGSTRWRALGRGVLLREATAQVHPDGGHAELSAHYHRYAFDFYLFALAVARANGDGDVASFLTGVCDRMATFCRAIADERGHLPMLGDDDGGMLFPICGRDPADASDSLCLAAALLDRPELAVGDPPEEVLWMLGGNRSALVRPLSRPDPPSSIRFEDTGYLVVRAAGEHLLMDAGHHGFLNGGHAHADALSIVLSADGLPLLIDPGTSTYTMDPQTRDKFRSSAWHNTVIVDGRMQSEPEGPFHWRTRANARTLVWRPAPAFDFVEAEHDGYAPIGHRRAIVSLHDRVWLVVDHVLGPGTHRVELYWHLHPAWQSAGGGSAAAEFRALEDRWAAFASTAPFGEEIRGDREGLGWCAPTYGRIEPASVLKFAGEFACPATVVTAIAAGPSARALRIDPLPVTADVADGWHRFAVAVADGTMRRVALFATPLPGSANDGPRAPYRAIGPDGTLATDARVAVLKLSDTGDPLTLSLVDGRAAWWSGGTPVTIRLPASAADLHLDIAAQRRLSRAGESQRLG